jgi:cytochrome c-type biogenesis protein CcmF
MHVNTLISFIWLGGLILFFGAVVAMWPEVAFEEAGAWGYVRAAASVATMVMFGTLLAAGSSQAYGAPLQAHVRPALSTPLVSIPQP